MLTRVVQFDEAHDRYIGRPTIWSNPFKIGRDGDRQQVLAKYAAHLRSRPDLLLQVHTLCGQRLACHCKPLPCHGDILADIANSVG